MNSINVPLYDPRDSKVRLVISLWAQLGYRDPQGGLVCLGFMETPVRMALKVEEGGRATLGWREIPARRVGEETLARLVLMEFLARTELRAMLVSRDCLETGEHMAAQGSQDCQELLGSLAVRVRWGGRAILDISVLLARLDPQDRRAQ